jgi:hypothetical protein
MRRCCVQHHRLGLRGRGHGFELIGRQVRSAQNYPAGQSVQFDERQGACQLGSGRQKDAFASEALDILERRS